MRLFSLACVGVGVFLACVFSCVFGAFLGVFCGVACVGLLAWGCLRGRGCLVVCP